MERRDFLIGSLVGLGVGAGASTWAHRTSAQVDADEAALAAEQAAAAQAATAQSAPAAAEPAWDPTKPPNIGPLDPDGRLLSYAQQGEDLLLLSMLKSLGIEKPSYLDIGSYHPVVSNNTYLLYAIGGRGVLVEPNPFFAQMSKQLRAEDTTLNVGVGTGEAREADYYVIAGRPQLNTFSKAQVDRYVEQRGPGALEKTVRMPLVPIDEILAEHFKGGAPDLLSLDVEGLDLAILESMDWQRYRPAVICVETIVYDTKEIVMEIVELLRANNYAVRGGTFVNTVFVDRARLGDGDVAL